MLEVIVAMVVILIVFVLATGIYANVVRTSPSMKQQRVKALVSGLLERSIAEGSWEDEVLVIDSLVLEKTVVPYQAYQDLLLVRVVAVEAGKEIARVKKVVRKEGRVNEAE